MRRSRTPILRLVPRASSRSATRRFFGVCQKLIKQRQDSVELYEKGGRAELAKQEKDEIEVIKGFMPAQMSEAEMKAAIAEVIKQTVPPA